MSGQAINHMAEKMAVASMAMQPMHTIIMRKKNPMNRENNRSKNARILRFKGPRTAPALI